MTYNFGYEFRLLGQNSEETHEKISHTINNKPKIESNRRHSDIIIPVQHETFVKITTNKGVKSEKTSSQTENNYTQSSQKKRLSTPKRPSHYDNQMEEYSSSSPLSLSPTLPSNSPRGSLQTCLIFEQNDVSNIFNLNSNIRTYKTRFELKLNIQSKLENLSMITYLFGVKNVSSRRAALFIQNCSNKY